MHEGKLNTSILKHFFENSASDEEKRYVLKVFSDKSYEEELVFFLKSQWHEILDDSLTPEKDLNHILYRINADILKSEPVSRRKSALSISLKWFSRIAAIFFIPLLIYTGFSLWNTNYKGIPEQIEIDSPAWAKIKFTLPDGTHGWLNSNSSIKYSGDYLQERKIKLTGEAFFDVVKNEKKPFYVLTNELQVKVTGTKFNIASFENEKSVEVVLKSGSLMLNSLGNDSHSIKMIPGDLISFDKNKKEFTHDVVRPDNYISWTHGKLVFRNDPIDVIARRLERWYNVDVNINGNVNKDIRLRATFLDENIDQVLYWIERSLPIDYKIIEGKMENNVLQKRKVEINIK